MMAKFPYRTKDELSVAHAKQVMRARYYDYVRSLSEIILKEAAKRFGSMDDAEEFIVVAIDHQVVSSQSVNSPLEAMNLLSQSDSWDTIDSMVAEISDDSLVNVITQAAYYALHADVSEFVDSHGSDYFAAKERGR